MIRHMVVLTVVVCLCAAAGAEAQEKIAIKLKEPAQGEIFVVKSTQSDKTVSKSADANGKALNQTVETKGKTTVYTTTILEQKGPDKTATALRRSYEKASTTKDDQPKVSDLEGKTVLIEKKGDKYAFRFDGGKELTTEQALDVDREFNRRKSIPTEQLLMPREPVAVGEIWTVDAATFMKATASPEEIKMFDVDKTRLAGKLVRVYEKDKRRFGVIEFTIEMPLKSNYEVQKGQKILDGQAVVRVTFDGCIDGSMFSRVLKGTTAFEVRMQIGTGETALTVATVISGQMEESREDGAKK
jgi:hypothetical protein